MLHIYLNVIVGHVVERFSEVLYKHSQKSGRRNQDQGFFVEDIDFLRDHEGSETGTQGNETSLGNERVTGERIDDTVGLFLGFSYI